MIDQEQKVIKTLRSSTFCQTSICSRGQKQYCKKSIDVSALDSEALKEQIAYLEQLQSKSQMVKYKTNLSVNENKKYLVLTSDVYKTIQLADLALDDQKISKIAITIYQVLKAMHKEGKAHRNLKLSNILVDKVSEEILLSDYTPKSFIVKKLLHKKHDNTQSYYFLQQVLAPESICEKLYGCASDVWVFGALLLQLFLRKPIQCLLPVGKHLYEIQSFLQNQKDLSVRQRTLLQKMLRKDSLNRSKLADLDSDFKLSIDGKLPIDFGLKLPVIIIFSLFERKKENSNQSEKLDKTLGRLKSCVQAFGQIKLKACLFRYDGFLVFSVSGNDQTIRCIQFRDRDLPENVWNEFGGLQNLCDQFDKPNNRFLELTREGHLTIRKTS